MKLYLSIFRKYVEKIEVFFLIWQSNGYFPWRRLFILWHSLAELFLEWGMFRTKIVEKIKKKTCFNFENFFPENITVYEIMWENNV